MRKILVTTVFVAVWSAITILAMLYGAYYDWPDNVHTDYGWPSAYATHTTSTFAGAADLWVVNTVYLATDLIFWLGSLTAAVAIIQIVLNKKQTK